MKKTLASALAAAAVLAGVGLGAGAAEAATVLNVRSSPGNGAVIGQLVNPDCRSLVRPIARKTVNGQNWNKARATNGRIGWAVNGGRYATWCH